MQDAPQHADIVWTPDAALARDSNLARFLARAGIQATGPEGYRQLVARADEDPSWFWTQVIEQAGLRFYRPYSRLLDASKGIEWARWCIGGTTNAALNCLDRHTAREQLEKDAIVWEAESGARQRWSYARLDAETSRLADGLRALGHKPGEVIGVCMPMVPQAAAALLAVVKIGAIVLPLYSGFGSQALAARLNDAGATALLTVDGTFRRGRKVPIKEQVDAAVPQVPSLKHVVVLRNSGEEVSWNPATDHWWHELCAGRDERAPTEPMPADAPMLLMYTSGTTGKPKGTVHTHCGLITKLALDMGLCADLKPTDRMLWMSDMGWLVGPILVYGTTLVGATMVLAEGAHDFPDEGRFWRLVQDNRVSLLGIAPTIVRSFMQAGGAGVERYDLSSLRVTISTGEPWTHGAWMWMFEKVCRGRIPIVNYSGGTEIGGGIVTGTVLHPMKPCALAGPVPGMGADVVDEEGRSIRPPGTGELVLRRPSMGLTRGLWNDPQRYIESYWSRWPGVWLHGDRTHIDAEGFWYVLGRSDDTLKIAGKRTGPSEVETLVMATGCVAEAAAIGLPDEVKGESLALVVTPMPGIADDGATRDRLVEAIIDGLGVAFRPRAILFVPDIPKTRNMKIMRRVIRSAWLGQDPGDLSSLVNPEAVQAIVAARQAGALRR